MKRFAALLFLLCLPSLSAVAEEPGPPSKLVEAITRQESGANPLAVNVAGKSYYPAT
jgi:soluble lytic murein transglycosylase-like protein